MSKTVFRRAKVTSWLSPDKSLCFLCAWILVKSASLHSYTTAFDAPFKSMAYITSPLFQLGSSAGILIGCLIVVLLVMRGRMLPFSMPVAVPAVLLVVAHATSALGVYELLPGGAMFAVMGFLWGVCTNMLALALIELLAVQGSYSLMALQLVMGFLAASSMATLLQGVNASVSALVCSAFLLGSVPLVRLCRKGEGSQNLQHQEAEKRGQGYVDRNAVLACAKENLSLLSVFFIAEAIIGMVNMFAFGGESSLAISTVMPMTGMAICAVVFLGIFALTSNVPSSHVLFVVVIPVMMALLILLPFLGVTHGGLLSTMLSVVFYLAALSATYCYVRSCKERGVSMYLFAAIVCGVERLVLLVGLGMGLVMSSIFPGDSFMRVTALAFVAVYALVLALLIPGFLRLRRTAAPAPEPHPAFAEEVVPAFGDGESSVFSSAFTNSSASSGPSISPLEAVAQTYALTPRELDVLRLIARGRDVAFASEELGLTRNTVQGYVKSIYAKLDVHSRRELHDLIENWE